MQRWLPEKMMCGGEWNALQFAKKMIKEKNFPVVYKEILEKDPVVFHKYDDVLGLLGFDRIIVSYGK